MQDGITFDDLMLVPQHSTINSRSLIDTSVSIYDFKWKHPIIPANMKTIVGKEMINKIIDSGGLAILHRFMPLEDQINISKEIILNGGAKHFGVSVGVKEEDKQNIIKFAGVGVRIFCIDVAHGDSSMCIGMTQFIRTNYPNSLIISGNVATGKGARRLWDAGADVVKCGLGGGSLCTTRIETGNGVPQMTAIMNVEEAKRQIIRKYEDTNRQFAFISDGGVKTAGDCVKALIFADMVMVGNLFSGAEETPSQSFIIDGISYKEYVGSSTHKTNHIEGVSAMVPSKGKYQDILTKILEGIKSGMSYQGVDNLKDLKENPEFIRISPAGLRESHPHDVRVIK